MATNRTQGNSSDDESIMLGNSVNMNDFIEEMASRGLITEAPPSPWKRFVSLLKAPFRFASGVLAWISWRLYGKAQFEIAVRKSLARWKQLAGVDGSSYVDVELQERRKAYALQILSDKPTTDAAAQAIHAEIIRSRITKVPVPAPDVDDTGVPVIRAIRT